MAGRLERLRQDERRSWVSAALSLPLVFGVTAAVGVSGTGDTVGNSLFSGLVGFTCWAAVYLVLTYLAFRKATWSELRSLPRSSTTRWRRRFLSDDAGAPTFAVSLAVGSLGASVLLFSADTVADALGRTVLLTTVAATVTLSWLVLALGYAVHYARLDAGSDGAHLGFPGDERPAFGSYLYFALSISTTFGSTDVTVLTGRLRRSVAQHGVAAFVFNTLIVAFVVAGLAR